MFANLIGASDLFGNGNFFHARFRETDHYVENHEVENTLLPFYFIISVSARDLTFVFVCGFDYFDLVIDYFVFLILLPMSYEFL